MRYPGGKGGAGVVQRIINLMPPHAEYVEPFLGGGAVMRAKLPAVVNVGVDRDPAAVALVEAWARTALPDGARARYEFRCGDGISYLQGRRWSTSALVYCDPPYLVRCRRQHRRLYRCELSDQEHERLLDVLTRLPCMVILSGYWSSMYAGRLSTWRVVKYRGVLRGGASAEECLWLNFPSPARLHDTRYVGSDYRERERVRRLQRRWAARIGRMGALERQALLDVLRAADTAAAGGMVQRAP